MDPSRTEMSTRCIISHKMENKKCHTVETVPQSNRKIAVRGNIGTPNPQIHDLSISWLGIDNSINSGGVKLVFCAHNLIGL